MYLVVSTWLYLKLNVFRSIPDSSYPMSSLDLQDSHIVPLTPSQQKIYMQIVGSLLVLSTRSRPDLSFPVNYLCLFMTKGTQNLDLCYKVVLQFIWQSRHLTLNFNGATGIKFSVMVSYYSPLQDNKNSNLQFTFPSGCPVSSHWRFGQDCYYPNPISAIESMVRKYFNKTPRSQIMSGYNSLFILYDWSQLTEVI